MARALIGDRSAGVPGPAGSRGPGAEPAILIVDDHAENLLALEAVLAPLGQRVVTASSGEEALRHLLHEDFAVILLDVRMPGMDGLETARYVRERGRTRHIPLIFLTAHSRDLNEIAHAYAVGAVDYVIKPFAPDILRSKVSVFVELSRERAERVRQASARVDAEAVATMVRKLQTVSDAALSHLELDELLSELLMRVAALFRAEATGVLMAENGGQSLALRATHGRALLAPGTSIALGEGPLGDVAQRRAAGVIDDAHVRSLPLAAGAGAVASVLAAPLVSGDELLGVLFLAAGSRHFSSEDAELLALGAERAAMAIAHANRFERERELVDVLQHSLLPERLPEHPMAALAARYRPSGETAQVGGDWYDALPLAGGRLGVAIGDVVGHGVRAATVMGELRNALRAFALEGHAPGEALQRLNMLVDVTHGGRMVATVLFMVFDPSTGTATIASAGHPPPLHLRADGSVAVLPTKRCPPLGIVSARTTAEIELAIAPGETLLLFTDGLIERRDEPIDAGLERLRLALGAAPADLDQLCAHVVEETQREIPSQDDLAVLALRRLAPKPGRLDLRLPATRESVPMARHHLRAWLSMAAIGEQAAFDLELICGEACANAVEHAYGPRDAEFSLSSEMGDGAVVLEVSDSGSWRPPRGRERGRGLKLIEALCDELELVHGESGTRVRVRKALEGAADALP